VSLPHAAEKRISMAHPYLGRVIRRQLDEHSLRRWPVNILEYFLGTPGIVTNVCF